MNTREQFGKYLLLKKLTEDPLGETFRAGMLGSKGMERVVLLRVFNGQGVDGGRLWQQTKDRAPIQQVLRSPNIGEGVEMGELQGIPYVAYDYVSGKNMATLLEAASTKQNYVPAEHALLIAERVALALAVACENRHAGDRILHGFLAPHLIMISNEGETRVLGFEVGPGLRGFATNPVIRQHFGRYLAPEAAAGQPLDRSDDIWSLGVLLFELMTSKPLPSADPGSYGPIVDGATLATEGTPIPADLAQLLKQSLVPRDQRIKDVATWHKTLNKWMFDGQYNPTTFNLAFYMHNLFRQEIEKESQEIEVEKTMPVPTPPPAPASADSASRQPDSGPGVSEATENFIPEYAKEESSSKAGLVIGIVAAVLIAAVAAFFFLGGGGDEAGGTGTDTQAAAQPAPPPPPAGPSEEELAAQAAQQQAEMLQEQIRKLVEERSASMEEELRKQYDQQLADLEQDLEEANKAKEAAKKAAEEKARREAEAAAEEEARLAAEEEARLAAEEEARKKAEEEARLAEERAKAEAEQAAASPTPVVPPPVVAPPPPAAAQAAPSVRRGDLVDIGDVDAPPQMTKPPQPRFPAVALRMGRTNATVKIKVLVDENGKVIDTQIEDKAGFGFDAEAENAARKAGFRAATKDGVPVKVWHTLSIEFRR